MTCRDVCAFRGDRRWIRRANRSRRPHDGCLDSKTRRNRQVARAQRCDDEEQQQEHRDGGVSGKGHVQESRQGGQDPADHIRARDDPSHPNPRPPGGLRRVPDPVDVSAVPELLQDEPGLTPDQVKYRLMATANKSWSGYNSVKCGAGYLDVYAAVSGTTTKSANTGLMASQLLSTGKTPITWGSVGWNSVGWNSVGWNSVGWNSVGWNSVGWNSDYWGP